MSQFPNNMRVFEGWSLPIMVLDTKLRYVFANDAYLKTVHKSYDELADQYVFDVFPETLDRVAPIVEKFKATLAGNVTQLEAQPFQIKLQDGSIEELVWQATQDPLRDENGNIIGMIQRCEDITRQYELEQRNKAIGYELSHRVKNIMAVVSSVARITGRNAETVHDFVKSFTARLNAMSRTNDLLAQGDWTGLDVKAVFVDELSPFEDADKEVITLTGPPVRLTIDATKDLSLVCHELMTNAVKYGCLGQDGGYLDVRWTRTGDTLNISWAEHCPEPIKPPSGIGFGTRLFDMLPYVTVSRDFTPTGLHLTITMDGEKVFA